jgi:hypothetical protein
MHSDSLVDRRCPVQHLRSADISERPDVCIRRLAHAIWPRPTLHFMIEVGLQFDAIFAQKVEAIRLVLVFVGHLIIPVGLVYF